jgi:glycine/D-amino acid oxidase-like deaminating enzyme
VVAAVLTAGTVAVVINGDVSFWWRSIGVPVAGPALGTDLDADVCIVGGGFTGLWTAYYLKSADPSLRVVLLEARFCGFGASGRNGGWLTASIAGTRRRYAATHGRDGVIALQHAMNESVDEVLRVTAALGIDIDAVKGGELNVATNEAQAQRLRADVEEAHAWGETDYQLLDADSSRRRIDVDGTVLGAWTRHCARIQPAKLAAGLAQAVRRLGVDVYESTPVTRIQPATTPGGDAAAVTAHGTVRATYVLRATEGFTSGLPGLHRTWLPMNSSLIVTEPLGADMWDEIGWGERETLGDLAHAYMYAQRTADDRIAIGGRGVPYRYGSRTDHDGKTHASTIAALHHILHRLLPVTRDAAVDHAWSGVLGVPRDWCSTSGLDRSSGLGWAGGYVGHGVTTTNLAGRTLRDLVLGEPTDLTALPWVGRKVRQWEPEPLRWLGVQTLYVAYRAADRQESRGGRTALLAKVADRISARD